MAWSINCSEVLNLISFFLIETQIQDCFGEFDGGVKLIDPNGTNTVATTTWVQIKKYTVPKDDNGEVCRGQFNAQLLHKTTTKVVIPSAQICHKVNIVHDCLDGHCQFRDRNRAVIEEREAVERTTFTFEHNFTNNRYLLNPFYLGNNALDLDICYDLEEPM